MSSSNPRANGLDTLRALAIALVFMYHYMVFVSREPTFGWASEVGWVGVDLFFVLSGYLIGNQLFAGLARGETLSPKFFYARRALRTWPAFWVVLAAYFLFPSVMGGKEPPPLWQFLSFTQNIQLRPGTAFSHAWSLCIEEQFYFVLPLVVLLALRIGTRRGQAWMLLALLVVVGIVARASLWSLYGREDFGAIKGYYPNVYYATLCRFDEFVPGLAVALLKNFHPQLWRRVTARGRASFALGIAASTLMLWAMYRGYYIDGYGYGFAMTAFGYSAVAAAFALLVISALSPASPLQRIRIPGAYHLALWSYSIYLSHKPLAHILNQYGQQDGWSSSATLIAITVAAVVLGAALYRLVEAPFMRLRDRRYPGNFTRPQGVAENPVQAEATMPAKPSVA
ncbi:MAG: acyltransferase [Sinimarinibacterium sp.]